MQTDYKEMENVSLNRIRQKLTSQSGASITYALLLFLVCAVVSSVVLAAGTAASGRMSQSVSNDQRYYSVTSAAEFLKKEIDGESVVLKKAATDGDDAYAASGSVKKLFSDISKSAILISKGSTGPYTQEYQLSVSGSETETLVDIDSSVEKFNDTNTPVLKMIITNHPADSDKEKDKLFSIDLEFTASIESRKEKKKKDVQKVTWSFYRLSIVQAA